jgi:hypothetical protein
MTPRRQLGLFSWKGRVDAPLKEVCATSYVLTHGGYRNAHETRSKQYSGKMISLEPLSWVGLCWAVLAEEATNQERRLFSWM